MEIKPARGVLGVVLLVKRINTSAIGNIDGGTKTVWFSSFRLSLRDQTKI